VDVAFHATEIEELEAALAAIKSARRDVSPRTLESVVCRIEAWRVDPGRLSGADRGAGVWVVTNPGFVPLSRTEIRRRPGPDGLSLSRTQPAGCGRASDCRQRRAGHAGAAAQCDRGGPPAPLDRRPENSRRRKKSRWKKRSTSSIDPRRG